MDPSVDHAEPAARIDGTHRMARRQRTAGLPVDAATVMLSAAVIELIAGEVAERLAASRADGPEPWVGVGEVARHLSCRPQRVYDLCGRRDGTSIPHRKEGSRTLFLLSRVDAWLDRGGRG